MRDEIKKLFINSENNFISGEEIARKLNISRTAIWKHIEQLKREGYIFEAVRKKGYRLINNPDDVFEERIKQGLATKWLGQSITVHKELESTQLLAHELAKKDAKHGTVVIADSQKSGKGRLGRKWYSDSGKGIWLSIILRPDFNYIQAPLITLLTSTVIIDSLKKLYNLEGKIKWPNDIYINNKKLSGILTEVHGEQDRIHYMIIGIGLNTHKTNYPADIKDKAVSLEEIIEKNPVRADIIRILLEQFENYYQIFEQEGFDPFYNMYNNQLTGFGKETLVINNNRQIKGINLGVDASGFLKIKRDDGEIIKVVSGDIDNG